MLTFFAQVDSLSGGAGWAGAGLLGLVLSWLLLVHLPAKDKMIREIMDTKDAQLSEILKQKWAALKEMSVDFRASLKEITDAWRREIDKLTERKP